MPPGPAIPNSPADFPSDSSYSLLATSPWRAPITQVRSGLQCLPALFSACRLPALSKARLFCKNARGSKPQPLYAARCFQHWQPCNHVNHHPSWLQVQFPCSLAQNMEPHTLGSLRHGALLPDASVSISPTKFSCSNKHRHFSGVTW